MAITLTPGYRQHFIYNRKNTVKVTVLVSGAMRFHFIAFLFVLYLTVSYFANLPLRNSNI
ncbi:hypothetical protein WAK64_11475 [Bacillus spongiae]|uniref:Uncharacterized protein n=1 Tax=Bacillus spongiae TaxID=2683610 RepID=A0ABU8HES6_9BACI